jgi:hypothetical protein
MFSGLPLVHVVNQFTYCKPVFKDPFYYYRSRCSSGGLLSSFFCLMYALFFFPTHATSTFVLQFTQLITPIVFKVYAYFINCILIHMTVFMV